MPALRLRRPQMLRRKILPGFGAGAGRARQLALAQAASIDAAARLRGLRAASLTGAATLVSFLFSCQAGGRSAL
jgi:hypothetical protein